MRTLVRQRWFHIVWEVLNVAGIAIILFMFFYYIREAMFGRPWLSPIIGTYLFAILLFASLKMQSDTYVEIFASMRTQRIVILAVIGLTIAACMHFF